MTEPLKYDDLINSCDHDWRGDYEEADYPFHQETCTRCNAGRTTNLATGEQDYMFFPEDGQIYSKNQRWCQRCRAEALDDAYEQCDHRTWDACPHYRALLARFENKEG